MVGGSRPVLLQGASAIEVNATRGADHLGDDPVALSLPTAAEVTAASREEGAPAPAVRHLAGARTGAELLGMGVLDVAVNSGTSHVQPDAGHNADGDVVEVVLTLTRGFEPSRQRGVSGPLNR